MMLTENRQALEEWAVVDEALASGEVALLIRKGGTRERYADFSVEHEEFWIHPTPQGQDPADLEDDVRPLLERLSARPPGGVRVRVYCSAEAVYRIEHPDVLDRLSGLHPLSRAAAHRRFRQNGRLLVHALLVRAYVLPAAVVLPESPDAGASGSWVELERALPTAPLVPVLSDEAFAGIAAEVARRVRARTA